MYECLVEPLGKKFVAGASCPLSLLEVGRGAALNPSGLVLKGCAILEVA